MGTIYYEVIVVFIVINFYYIFAELEDRKQPKSMKLLWQVTHG